MSKNSQKVQPLGMLQEKGWRALKSKDREMSKREEEDEETSLVLDEVVRERVPQRWAIFGILLIVLSIAIFASGQQYVYNSTSDPPLILTKEQLVAAVRSTVDHALESALKRALSETEKTILLTTDSLVTQTEDRVAVVIKSALSKLSQGLEARVTTGIEGGKLFVEEKEKPLQEVKDTLTEPHKLSYVVANVIRSSIVSDFTKELHTTQSEKDDVSYFLTELGVNVDSFQVKVRDSAVEIVPMSGNMSDKKVGKSSTERRKLKDSSQELIHHAVGQCVSSMNVEDKVAAAISGTELHIGNHFHRQVKDAIQNEKSKLMKYNWKDGD
eukprot:g3931.t1